VSGASDLLQAVDATFRASRDPIVDGLVQAARDVVAFLQGTAIRWDQQVPSKGEAEGLLQSIEDQCRTYWRALARIVQDDKSGRYDDAILGSLQLLAVDYAAPTGVAFTKLGVGLRYYPLVVALHIVYVVGVANRRSELLKRCTRLHLEPVREDDEPEHVGNALFYLRRSDELFQVFHPNYPQQRWCDGVATRLKAIVQSLIGDKPVPPTDRDFFIGEFVLSLVPLDVPTDSQQYRIAVPASGNFLYFSGASRAIVRFLGKNVDWLGGGFERPLPDLLKEFDEKAHQLVSARCFGDGLVRGTVAAAYPQKKDG
jgi:hypothetical protein